MNLDDVEKFFKDLFAKPLKTIGALLIIVVLGAGGVWVTTFLQERAKKTALLSSTPIGIFVKEFGFKGIRDNTDKRDVRQLFGDPIEERESFLKYKGFGIGFQEKYVSNINFCFGEDVDWCTEDGISQGMTRQQVIEVYGIPNQAAFEGEIFYYDRFNICFDKAGIIQKITVYIGERKGVTFSEIEDALLDLRATEDKTNSKQSFDQEIDQGIYSGIRAFEAFEKALEKKEAQTGSKEGSSNK